MVATALIKRHIAGEQHHVVSIFEDILQGGHHLLLLFAANDKKREQGAGVVVDGRYHRQFAQ